jgi:hypothetical protein
MAWLALCAAQAAEERTMPLVFCCEVRNDLYRALSSVVACPRYDRPMAAVEAAPAGGGVLLLADGYPENALALPDGLWERAAARRLRLYVEFPAALPDMEVGAARAAVLERGVVSSDFFGPELPALRILALHGCRFVPVRADTSHLVMARVAGFDEAVFGLPPETQPILFEHARGGALVATTKLSQFVTARYAPSAAWQSVWRAVLRWLAPGQDVPSLNWTATVRPSFGPDQALPPDAEPQALQRGSGWFQRSGLLARSSTAREVTPGSGLLPPGPARGDGTHGIGEGFAARIDCLGNQEVLANKRSDCNGESAMGIAFGAAVADDPAAAAIAGNILDYWFGQTIAAKGVRADPAHPAYGLVAWGITDWAWEKAFYGDDNARLLLGTIASAALLRTDRWDETILRCLLGNLRTTGRRGFRQDRIDLPDLEQHGWRRYYDAASTSYAPHYQAYLWACYLWAFRATGYQPFLERTENALRMTMAAYPEHWRWTNGIAQERARLLLPLAWLVRLRDTPEHRAWLHRVATDLLALQAPCGALREQLGASGLGAYGPPRSNEEYGTNEATLMQTDGDPVCDLLYTTNFAFIGLHEAAAATGDSLYAVAADRLAAFLCRIQVRSEAHPELDGGWFRAFDFRRWEYWASSADAGWGAWSIETGWTQGWITAVFGLRALKTSFWELTAGCRLQDRLTRLLPQFFPDGDAPVAAATVRHLALERPVQLATPCSPWYPGGGAGALTDGYLGSPDYLDPAWQGFEGADLDAVVDLGRSMRVSVLRSHYLQQVPLGVFLPRSVEYALSTDGGDFRVVATVTDPTPEQAEGPLVREFTAHIEATEARWVRVRARSRTVVPDWHAARGRKAWLFADEILIE